MSDKGVGMEKKRYLAAALICASVFAGAEAETYNGEAAIGYEEWKLPGGETMGMTRVGMLFDITPWWYGGVDLFGAVRGERGGFFTFGFESGLQTDPTLPWQLRGGMFVGAGGGGAGPQGSGLMLRPYAEVRYRAESFSLGVGVSYVDFPDGGIDSTQVFGSFYLPLNGLYRSGWSPGAFGSGESAAEGVEIESLIRAGRYFVSGSSRTTGGARQEDLDWVGVEVRRFFGETGFVSLSSAGAGGGSSDGYMEVFGGAGARVQLADWPLYATLQGELGTGGGGAVDTGGGPLWRVRGGLEARIARHLVLGIEGGHVESFEGSFKADSLGGYLGFDRRWGGSGEEYLPAFLSVRAIEKTHFTGRGDFKDPARSDRLSLMGIAVDHALGRHLYMTGQALWAFDGGSGGYTEGLMGLGVQSDEWHGMRVWGELLGGAGGGGGVKTGGGALGSLSVGGSVALGKAWDLMVGAGYTRAGSDGFSSVDGTLQFRYRFSLPRRR